MSDSREEILADFQACTGIEDLAIAIYHLDESNWDLVQAVTRVMPPDSQSFHLDREDNDVMIVSEVNGPSLPTVDEMELDIKAKRSSMKFPEYLEGSASLPSTSKGEGLGKNLILFNIQYNNKIVSVKLKDSATINDLKLAVQREFKISPCRQLLVGWRKTNQDENTPFSKLVVDTENNLALHVKAGAGGFTADKEYEDTEKLNSTYTLNIKYDDQIYNLKFEGITPILEIKTGMYALTNIEVRNQIWSGWPPNVDDQMLLGLSGINFPEHNFILSRNCSLNNKDKERLSSTSVIKIDSDEDEYEDASESFNVDDDYFVEEVATRKTEPLIPDNVDDEIVGSVTFIERFTARYGPIHPCFFQGSLKEAIQEACNKPAKDRKVLAIYLHHDSSVLTNVFCTQLLGFESVMQIFERKFILWGWDLTLSSNAQKLHQYVASNLGAVASMSIQNISVDRLPAIVSIMRNRSSTDIFSVVHGNVGVNELLSSLIEAVEVFNDHQRIEIKEEQERTERELVKWEQDVAYRESLEADKAKEEAKRSKEEAEKEARRMFESVQAEEIRKREEHRMAIEKALPLEPPLGQGDKEAITHIRFRLPSGEHLERRFHISTPLKVLLDFLIVKGYPSQEYKVISSWPRKDLSTLNQLITLQELKLYPQETVILEER